MSARLDAAFAAARDHLAEKDQRIQFLEAAMATVFVNLRRAPEKAMAVATFASAIMRGVSLQEAVAEAEKEGDPSSIVEVTATPSQRLDAATVERLRELAEAADDAWQGLKQTQLAASEVGVEIAQSVREGYGLHLTLALRDLAAALATEPHQHGGKGA